MIRVLFSTYKTLFDSIGIFCNYANKYEVCLISDSDDLWKFMSKSSGIDVGSLMNSWIRKMGFPVVVVTVIKTLDNDISGKITLKLTQHRFCGGNTNSPQKEPMLWSIPIKGDYVNVKKFKN